MIKYRQQHDTVLCAFGSAILCGGFGGLGNTLLCAIEVCGRVGFSTSLIHVVEAERGGTLTVGTMAVIDHKLVHIPFVRHRS